MRHLDHTGLSRERLSRGFSLTELLIVITVMLVATGISAMIIQPALQDARVTSAYNATLTTLRRAHDEAAAERRVYVVNFDNTVSPNTVTISQNATLAAGGILLVRTTLPSDITFHAEPGIPTNPAGACSTPDGFGTGVAPIDFDQGVGGGSATTIYFYPDGSAHDAPLNGNFNSGVVYLGRPGQLNSSRAITVWGTTGRIRGWRLTVNGAAGCWRPQ